MKILLLSDLAGKTPEIDDEIIQLIDFVLIAGDVTLGAKSLSRAEKNFKKLSVIFPPPLLQ